MPITRASPNPQVLLVSGHIFAGREFYLEWWCCWNLNWVLLLGLAGCCGRSVGRSQVGAGFMGRK